VRFGPTADAAGSDAMGDGAGHDGATDRADARWPVCAMSVRNWNWKPVALAGSSWSHSSTTGDDRVPRGVLRASQRQCSGAGFDQASSRRTVGDPPGTANEDLLCPRRQRVAVGTKKLAPLTTTRATVARGARFVWWARRLKVAPVGHVTVPIEPSALDRWSAACRKRRERRAGT